MFVSIYSDVALPRLDRVRERERPFSLVLDWERRRAPDPALTPAILDAVGGRLTPDPRRPLEVVFCVVRLSGPRIY